MVPGELSWLDTLGEVVVIFTGGWGFLLILTGTRRVRTDKEDDNET